MKLLPFASLACAAVGVVAWLTYPARLSRHEGVRLVEARDLGPSAAIVPPRYTFLAVVDGLGVEEARGMASTKKLAELGVCLPTHVPSPTTSRAAYAVLATGLEPDRSGARHNDDTSPLAAMSLFEVARERGIRTVMSSAARWWHELFPRGFDALLRRDALFLQVPPADASYLVLLHALYVDEAGHESGAASELYRNAVARADAELGNLIASADFDRDLLVVTGDHGHSARGGHGGLQPRVSTVLTCWAGRGVRRGAATGTDIDATAIAPSLSFLLGTRLPPHVRATADDLDAALALVDPAKLGQAYVDDRRRAIERTREVNRAAVAAWIEGAASWSDAYRARRRTQHLVFYGGSALGLLSLAAALRRAPRAIAAAAIVPLFAVASFLLLRGSFDLTAVNGRPAFVRDVAILWVIGAAIGTLVDRARAIAVHLAVAVAIALVLAVHVVAFGVRLDAPLPVPELLFLPAFLAVALTAQGGVAALASVVALVRARR